MKPSYEKRLLKGHAGDMLFALITRLLYWRPARRLMITAICRFIRRRSDRVDAMPLSLRRIEQQRNDLYLAIAHTIGRSLDGGAVAPKVARRVLQLWAGALSPGTEDRPAVRRFRSENGCQPPRFITISPGRACNLSCSGCYANSDSGGPKLEWSVLDRLIAEARESWDIQLIVFSGGEPLLYRSENRSPIDVAERNPDLLFLMFTNGTVLDTGTAARLGETGNLTLAFSVEGMRQSTDRCRGDGIFDSVLESMAVMRSAGVPYGISVAVTRHNCDEVLSDEFLDFFFHQQKAFYCFFFQYLPIGRNSDMDNMPTPEQRVSFLHRSRDVIARQKLFLVDFWNHGPLVGGCIAAGRGGGYLHIDWNGSVMPCVFAPYSAANIHDVFARGGTLNDVWKAPFLQAIRQWQRTYGYAQPRPSAEANWLRPCPFRDHHGLFSSWVDTYKPEPQEEAVGESMLDDRYRQSMVQYGLDLGRLVDEIWEAEYLGFRKPR